MSHIDEVRAGLEQAHINEKVSGIIFFENVVIPIIVGSFFHSFAAGCILFLVLYGILVVTGRIGPLVLSLTYSLFWTILAITWLGLTVHGIIIGILVFMVSFLLNFGSMQYFSDLGNG